MRILMITTNDPAGTAINFTNALNRYTPHRCRLVTTEIRYNFMFKKDLHIPWMSRFDELYALLKEADVFHFHMTADEHLQLGPYRVRDFIKGKKIVHHHHGEPPFRADPRSFAERELALGRRAIVSTPDLWQMYPEATWIPNPVPLWDVLYLPAALDGMPLERVVVTHSPTRKELKNTDLFLRVTAALKARVPKLYPLVIENTPHETCLRIKRESHVFFDHMQGYYGVSSLEALSQGVPTVAGLDDWNQRCLKEFTGAAKLPWVIARDEESLTRAIEALATDELSRREIGRLSRAWMEKYWSEERIARALVAVYEAL